MDVADATLTTIKRGQKRATDTSCISRSTKRSKRRESRSTTSRSQHASSTLTRVSEPSRFERLPRDIHLMLFDVDPVSCLTIAQASPWFACSVSRSSSYDRAAKELGSKLSVSRTDECPMTRTEQSDIVNLQRSIINSRWFNAEWARIKFQQYPSLKFNAEPVQIPDYILCGPWDDRKEDLLELYYLNPLRLPHFNSNKARAILLAQKGLERAVIEENRMVVYILSRWVRASSELITKAVTSLHACRSIVLYLLSTRDIKNGKVGYRLLDQWILANRRLPSSPNITPTLSSVSLEDSTDWKIVKRKSAMKTNELSEPPYDAQWVSELLLLEPEPVDWAHRIDETAPENQLLPQTRVHARFHSRPKMIDATNPATISYLRQLRF